MNSEKFEKITKKGISAIPEKFLQKLENVAIVIEKSPSQEQLNKMKMDKNYLLLGLYEGIPKTKRGEYANVLPDKITIFQNPIEQIAQTEPAIIELVKNTIWHEIAHHFGMNEQEVRIAEKSRYHK